VGLPSFGFLLLGERAMRKWTKRRRKRKNGKRVDGRGWVLLVRGTM